MMNTVESCNFCGYVGEIIWAEEKYTALRCRNCGVIWTFPQPNLEELKNIYSCNYFEKYYLKYEKERKNYFRKRLKEIEEIINVGELLDIGCGVGFFLEVAKEKGWEVKGVEISRFACEYVKNKLGFKVYQGNLTQIDLPSSSFDLITIWDVIAHLSNPKEYLERTSNLLRNGGLLVIKTPNHPLRFFKLVKLFSFTGRSRGLLHIPAQSYHFGQKNLSNLLERFGFKIIKVKKIQEALKGKWTNSLSKNFLISLFNMLAKIFGIEESFIIYAIKR